LPLIKLGNPSMNYKNDLGECLTYLNYFFYLPNSKILFVGLPNFLSHSN
jgi:hypothetical protein